MGLAVCRRGSLVPCGRCSRRAQGAKLHEFSDRLLGKAMKPSTSPLPEFFAFKSKRFLRLAPPHPLLCPGEEGGGKRILESGWRYRRQPLSKPHSHQLPEKEAGGVDKGRIRIVITLSRRNLWGGAGWRGSSAPTDPIVSLSVSAPSFRFTLTRLLVGSRIVRLAAAPGVLLRGGVY